MIFITSPQLSLFSSKFLFQVLPFKKNKEILPNYYLETQSHHYQMVIIYNLLQPSHNNIHPPSQTYYHSSHICPKHLLPTPYSLLLVIWQSSAWWWTSFFVKSRLPFDNTIREIVDLFFVVYIIQLKRQYWSENLFKINWFVTSSGFRSSSKVITLCISISPNTMLWNCSFQIPQPLHTVFSPSTWLTISCLIASA